MEFVAVVLVLVAALGAVGYGLAVPYNRSRERRGA